MKQRSIAGTDRNAFFARFTQEHAGALVTLRVNAYEEVVDRPLRAVRAEGDDVVVEAGGAHLGHRIPHVGEVKLELTDAGADSAVQLTLDDGARAEIRFRFPILPDAMDPAVE
jgi:hypothetical protein